MSNSISPLFSPLYSFILDDWIAQLGEKAVLSWLRFHSWKDGQVSLQDPFLLPFSLNKIIQRLKIGKATFYNKILRPLLDHGLIRLQPAPDTPRELHMLVFSHPDQAADQQADPSSLLKSSPESQPQEDPSSSSSSPDKEKQDTPSVELTPAHHRNLESSDLPDVQPIPPASKRPSPAPIGKETDHATPCPKMHDDVLESMDFLPIELQQAIFHDSRLMERKEGIVQAYQECQKHPLFNDADFQQKMLTCVTYSHDPQRFGAYLRKSLFNLWNKASSPSAKKPSPPSPQPRAKDVPEWVFQQQERQRKNIPHQNQGLNPDQQAEADRLLQALGEI